MVRTELGPRTGTQGRLGSKGWDQLGRCGEERADVIGVADDDRLTPDVAVSAPDVAELATVVEWRSRSGES